MRSDVKYGLILSGLSILITILLWVSGLHSDVAKFQTSVYIGYSGC